MVIQNMMILTNSYLLFECGKKEYFYKQSEQLRMVGEKKKKKNYKGENLGTTAFL
jgi:hypothetical protein